MRRRCGSFTGAQNLGHVVSVSRPRLRVTVTTGVGANLTRTIVALAIRQAEYIIDQLNVVDELKRQAIPVGHAGWDGRGPGGSVTERSTADTVGAGSS